MYNEDMYTFVECVSWKISYEEIVLTCLFIYAIVSTLTNLTTRIEGASYTTLCNTTKLITNKWLSASRIYSRIRAQAIIYKHIFQMNTQTMSSTSLSLTSSKDARECHSIHKHRMGSSHNHRSRCRGRRIHMCTDNRGRHAVQRRASRV